MCSNAGRRVGKREGAWRANHREGQGGLREFIEYAGGATCNVPKLDSLSGIFFSTNWFSLRHRPEAGEEAMLHPLKA